jgi:hypothetical protein
VRDTEFHVNLMGQKAIRPYMMTVLQPRPKGEFVIDTLVLGAPFHITGGLGRFEAYAAVQPLKPDEDRDIGTIILKERQR